MRENFGNIKPSEEQREIAERRNAEEQAEREANERKNIEIAELRAEAPVKAKALLAERVPVLSKEELSQMPYIQQLDRIDAKIDALNQLLDELDAKAESLPEEERNKLRFLAEALGEMLMNEEANRELLPSLDGIAERVDRDELRGAIEAVLDQARDDKAA